MSGRPAKSRQARLVDAAAVALVLLGLANVLGGVLALVAERNFDADALPAGTLALWAVLLLGLGAIDLITAKLVRDRHPLGAVMGLLIAGLGLIVHVLFLGTYPVLSIVNLALDALILYALITCGDEFP